MTEYCDFGDLPADMCGCTKCKPEVRETAEPGSVSVVFTARYDSPCDYCDRWIKGGSQMGFDQDDNRICERCLP